ncbi:hypothetical protein ACHAWF_017478 [Thalassiosira exigua]
MFWESHRPDIVEESRAHGKFVRPDTFAVVAVSAGFVITEMADVMGPNQKIDEEGTRRLDDLARTPVVSRAYTKLNGTSDAAVFVVGLIQLLGSDKATPGKDHIFWILNQFIFCGLVDKHVIEGLVSFGAAMNAYDDSLPTVHAMFNMLVSEGEQRGAGPAVPNDSRCAAAIKSGLFDMILHIVQKFSRQVKGDLIERMTNLLDAIGQLALLQRTSEALLNCQSHVLSRLQKNDQNALVQRKFSGVLESIRSIFKQVGYSEQSGDLNMVACRRCYKVLKPKDKKVCTGCKRAIYCGRECQVADWRAGHKRDCKYMATQSEQVKMAGHSKRHVEKAKEHEKNISMAGNKVFIDNLQMIMMRAIFEGRKILFGNTALNRTSICR